MIRMKALVILASLLAAGALHAQKPDKSGRGEKKPEKNVVKSYDAVIDAKTETDHGVFSVHRKGDKVFYEIPVSQLEKPFLWVTQISKTQTGFGFGGTSVGRRVVRWVLRDEMILLRDVKFGIRVDDGQSRVANAVAASSLEPIIRTFPVKCWGRDKAPVVEVTGLFMEDVSQFSAKRRLGASGIDKKRCFFDGAKSFPENIETDVTMTYKLKPQTGATRRRSAGTRRRDPSQDAVTVVLHHSMVSLPEKPMAARVHDERVGFFTVSFEDYGDAEDHAVERTRYITRWRLEKKDPSKAVSDPVKPVVFHVGRGVPERWRPWVHKGIEAWQPAFAAAGFSNAILAKDAPDAREDPDWDAEDARYSTIRWMPSTIENAMGPHVHDPRTGEILEADIIMYHNVLKLIRDWYFVQASPNDPRARKLPLPDDVVGECLAYVVAHEVGHSLGFPHNMKASSSYSVEQLRDADFTAKNGVEASIMDYGRFNYVAQPGDNARLIPVIGPYDFFAVDWGYRQYDDEKAREEGLAALTARQISDPTTRFGGRNPTEDPSQQTEDLGSDAVAATRLGLKNIDRVASYLVDACCREGKNYDLLSNMYEQLVRQRNREIMHVANVIGGSVKTNLWYGDADHVYRATSREKQREAMAFVNEHGLRTPRSLVRPDIVLRLEASGTAKRLLDGQKRILTNLLAEKRVERMAEHAEMFPGEAFLPEEMLTAIREEIWGELAESEVVVDLYRRGLQRVHVDILAKQAGKKSSTTDLPALSRRELETLAGQVSGAIDRCGNRTTEAHLRHLRARIRDVLDEKDENEGGTP